MADNHHPDPNQDKEQQQQSSPDSPPSKLPRIDPSSDPDAVTTAIPSPFTLGLGLSVGAMNTSLTTSLTTTTIIAEKETSSSNEPAKKTGFTFMQMQEFHHQALIFKHMVAGFPVPIHLILPIWKSVAASYGPHHYPSFVGLGNLCYDFRNSMEPEPGRCRRTDGKKWRCSRDVVTEQKYCERHMHRGRNRSRKPVEGPPPTSTSTSTAVLATVSSNCIDTRENNSSSSSIDVNRSEVVVAGEVGRIESSQVSVLTAEGGCKTG